MWDPNVLPAHISQLPGQMITSVVVYAIVIATLAIFTAYLRRAGGVDRD